MTSLRKDDLKDIAKEFAESFLKSNSDTGGVAVTDAKVEAQQIDPKDYVPNFEILKSSIFNARGFTAPLPLKLTERRQQYERENKR